MSSFLRRALHSMRSNLNAQWNDRAPALPYVEAL